MLKLLMQPRSQQLRLKRRPRSQAVVLLLPKRLPKLDQAAAVVVEEEEEVEEQKEQ
jgi:hypothetical protein